MDVYAAYFFRDLMDHFTRTSSPFLFHGKIFKGFHLSNQNFHLVVNHKSSSSLALKSVKVFPVNPVFKMKLVIPALTLCWSHCQITAVVGCENKLGRQEEELQPSLMGEIWAQSRSGNRKKIYHKGPFLIFWNIKVEERGSAFKLARFCFCNLTIQIVSGFLGFDFLVSTTLKKWQ